MQHGLLSKARSHLKKRPRKGEKPGSPPAALHSTTATGKCRWLDFAAKTKDAPEGSQRRPRRPSEPAQAVVPRSQFDHDENEEENLTPLLAQAARPAKAHSVRMREVTDTISERTTKPSVREGGSPVPEKCRITGASTRSLPETCVKRVQSHVSRVESSPCLVREVSLRDQRLPRPMRQSAEDGKLVWADQKPPPQTVGIENQMSVSQVKRKSSRGKRLGEMMAGKLSSGSIERHFTTHSASTVSSVRGDTGPVERSYIPIGLGIMSKPEETRSEVLKKECESGDDNDDLCDESVYSQDSGSGSASDASGSSATTCSGRGPAYEDLVPDPLKTHGLNSETMSSQRTPGSSFLPKKGLHVLPRRSDGSQALARSQLSSARVREGENRRNPASAPARRALVPPPGRLYERELLPTPKSRLPLRESRSVQNAITTRQKCDTYGYAQENTGFSQQAGEEARPVREASGLFLTNSDTEIPERRSDPVSQGLSSQKRHEKVKELEEHDQHSESMMDRHVSPGQLSERKLYMPNRTRCSSGMTKAFGEAIGNNDAVQRLRYEQLEGIMVPRRQQSSQNPPSPHTSQHRPVSAGNQRPLHPDTDPNTQSLLPRTYVPTPPKPSSPSQTSLTKDLVARPTIKRPSLDIAPLSRFAKDRLWNSEQEAQGPGDTKIYTYFDSRRKVRNRPTAGEHVMTSKSTRPVCDKLIRKALGVVDEGVGEEYEEYGQQQEYQGGYGDIFDLYAGDSE